MFSQLAAVHEKRVRGRVVFIYVGDHYYGQEALKGTKPKGASDVFTWLNPRQTFGILLVCQALKEGLSA